MKRKPQLLAALSAASAIYPFDGIVYGFDGVLYADKVTTAPNLLLPVKSLLNSMQIA